MNRRRLLPLALALPFSEPLLGAPRARLRLMSYNIKRGFGMDQRTDLERTIEYVARQKPDLLALQEVDRNCRRSGSVDQAAVMGKALGMEASFHKFMDYDGGEYGLAILSRLPVKKTVTHELPPGVEPRVAGEIQVEMDGEPLSFVSLHLDWTTTERRIPQAHALTEALAARKHSVILGGDFNAKPGSPTMKLFGEDYHVVAKQGHRLTFPADVPKIEIDFFAARNVENPQKLTSRVLDEPLVSDHRPLVMEF